MIIESILTTLDARGTVNVAPMGVEWGDEAIVIKPFLETTTFRNLQATAEAVVNLTDDVLLFARGAIAHIEVPTTPASMVRGAVLEAAILATRTHLLTPQQIRDEFARLQVIVDKTAGPREREAMALPTEYVRTAPPAPPAPPASTTAR